MRALSLTLLLLLAGCPAQNSTPCDGDAQCSPNQRCRLGACGPICLDDTECGSAQVCRGGVCKEKPQCASDTQCAAGFTCVAEKCQCESDAACGANRQCVAGACQANKRCTLDADCLREGKRCEVSQGVCLGPCRSSQECAPTLEANVALALYSCELAVCKRRCLNDVTCGGQGIICQAGVCELAQCKTRTDCPSNQYCTDATFGRCLEFQVCTDDSACSKNQECKKFSTPQCPPGFDCRQSICRDRPRCFIDADCTTALPGQPKTVGFCESGICRPSTACTVSATCAAGQDCVAGLCVPAVCRGLRTCGPAAACVDGACTPAPNNALFGALTLSPGRAVLEVGDTLQLSIVGLRLDGASYPATGGTFTFTDGAGAPSAALTVDGDGLATAAAPGTVTVVGRLPGSTLATAGSTITVYPRVTAGRRALVLDAATLLPIAQAAVRLCPEPTCAAPQEAVTDAQGVALFPAAPAGALTLSVVAPALRPLDNLPRYERVTFLGVTGADVVVPLRDNPVEAAAGFNASLRFTDVTTSGQYWLGYVVASADDVPSLDLATLLGETFQTNLSAINQTIPLPGSVVVYTSPGLGIPQEVKPRALGLAQAGRARRLAAFAGRANLDQALTLRSTDFLSYLGAFDYALLPTLELKSFPRVDDATDLDGDGLCSNTAKCPTGTERVPDYGSFTTAGLSPSRPQQRRTEVVVPRVPSTLTNVLVAAVELSDEAGLLPVGLSSRTAGMVGADGTRPVDPVLLQSGAPYGGVELSTPGILVLGTSAGGNQQSGRLSKGPTLPSRIPVAPFLPVPANASYSASTRKLTTGQPEWASIAGLGAQLGRASLTGSEVRHTLYFPISAGQSLVDWPAPPAGPGVEPSTEAMPRLSLVAIDLVDGLSVEEAYTLAGPNLSRQVFLVDGYSRLDR